VKPLVTGFVMIVLSAGIARADDEAYKDASIIYTNCILRQAKALDDHKSDAATIAGVIVAVCSPQLTLLNTLKPGSLTEDGSIALATVAVLKGRSTK